MTELDRRAGRLAAGREVEWTDERVAASRARVHARMRVQRRARLTIALTAVLALAVLAIAIVRESPHRDSAETWPAATRATADPATLAAAPVLAAPVPI